MNKPVELTEKRIKEWMKILLSRAEKIGSQGEIPVTAIILNEFGHCIGHGSNRREQASDPLGHAELIALKQASLIKKDWRFNECTLIVNLEPCTMCAAAIIQARMGKVIYGAKDSKRGGLGGTIDLSTHISSHHYMTVIGGIMSEKSTKIIKEWFKKKRSIKS